MAAPKRGLGSGLSALLESNSDVQLKEKDKKEEINILKLEKITPNVDQPRKIFNDEKLQELAESIKENGIIQPIIVQKQNDAYMIIAGERRYRASKLAGLTEIPCIIKDYTPETLIKVSLLENIQREDLNPLEEAETYKRIIDAFQITQETLAKELGKSRTYITNSMRLLKLSPYVKDLVIEGKLSQSHARTLITIEDFEMQNKLADKIINEKLNVRAVEDIQTANKTTVKTNTTKLVIPEYIEIENNLKNYFGTKVRIHKGPKSGKIEINYCNDDDLERILNMIGK